MIYMIILSYLDLGTSVARWVLADYVLVLLENTIYEF